MQDIVITIGRQHGTDGCAVGRRLSQDLGIPYYDKDLLRDYAVENGLGQMLMESYGEKHASSLLFSLSTSAYSFGYFDASQDSTIGQKAYLTAFESVRDVAKKGPCVIVGRCADYVLRDHPGLFSVFLHAPADWRAQRLAARKSCGAPQAMDEITEQDRMRRCYYNYYTKKNWGEPGSYHLTLDRSCWDVGRASGLIQTAIALSGQQSEPLSIPTPGHLSVG